MNAFRPFSELPGYACMLAVLFAGVAIFLACALIDWLRSLLFRLLRVRDGSRIPSGDGSPLFLRRFFRAPPEGGPEQCQRQKDRRYS